MEEEEEETTRVAKKKVGGHGCSWRARAYGVNRVAGDLDRSVIS